MLFNSLPFWMFLPVVVFTYWMVPKRCIQGRNLILLVASYIFYAYWDYRFLGLIVFSTLVDYAAALFIQASEQTGRKRSALILSLIVNLGILGYFKYFDFFIESALTVLNQLGFSGQYTSLGIILPVGISFYTFQSMSYTIDVFRKRQKAERNPLYVALYVAFFPQLMAGPIERAGTFIPQLKDQRELYFGNLIKGFHRFLLGMVKKVVVSGPITAYTTLQWLNPALRSTEEVWFMSILFFLALLMDFSGYSDMAIGIARMFGIQLSENFRRVFRAKNFTSFWQRWHITLGRWFRDYVFLPMMRDGYPRWLTVVVVFSLIGFWHGAAWHFILWGLLMGVAWYAESRFNGILDNTFLRTTRLGSAVQSVLFFCAFLFTGQLFVSPNVEDAFVLMKTMVGIEPATCLETFRPLERSTSFALVLGFGIELLSPYWSHRMDAGGVLGNLLWWLRTLVLIPMAIILCVEGLWSTQEFVYFLF